MLSTASKEVDIKLKIFDPYAESNKSGNLNFDSVKQTASALYHKLLVMKLQNCIQIGTFEKYVLFNM